jgi:hypothetical protein
VKSLSVLTQKLDIGRRFSLTLRRAEFSAGDESYDLFRVDRLGING